MFCWQVNNSQPRAAGGLTQAGPRRGGKSPRVPAWYRPGRGKRGGCGAWGPWQGEASRLHVPLKPGAEGEGIQARAGGPAEASI